jgi:IS5 family transposase
MTSPSERSVAPARPRSPHPRLLFISGQKRGIKRGLRCRSAIEPVRHLKTEGHLGRCYLKGRAGDAANAILAAVGYNLRRILAWAQDSFGLFSWPHQSCDSVLI